MALLLSMRAPMPADYLRRAMPPRYADAAAAIFHVILPPFDADYFCDMMRADAAAIVDAAPRAMLFMPPLRDCRCLLTMLPPSPPFACFRAFPPRHIFAISTLFSMLLSPHMLPCCRAAMMAFARAITLFSLFACLLFYATIFRFFRHYAC
jgi:hypothetical protein